MATPTTVTSKPTTPSPRIPTGVGTGGEAGSGGGEGRREEVLKETGTTSTGALKIDTPPVQDNVMTVTDKHKLTVTKPLETNSTNSSGNQYAEAKEAPMVSCVVVGGPKVGKTRLTNEILKKLSVVDSEQIRLKSGVACRTMTSTPTGIPYILCITDVPSPGLEDEGYVQIMEGAEIILLCFAVDDPRSFYQLKRIWIPFITLLKIHGFLVPHAAAAIVGTKCDLVDEEQTTSKEIVLLTPRKKNSKSPTEKPDKNRRTSSIKPDKILSLVDQLGAEMFIQTSAINGKGIAQLINEFIPRSVLKPTEEGSLGSYINIRQPQTGSNRAVSGSNAAPSTSKGKDGTGRNQGKKQGKSGKKYNVVSRHDKSADDSKKKKCTLQ
ncbi:uncharacterized protein LOC142336179 isoform X2 [Convolutriloba macropyga]|uniref:uncharacterized protein LOC142336179 isoform X2 n=1 Tax=Convolutriloba macropyga TaxID=536237 RepID=UPI003F52895D